MRRLWIAVTLLVGSLCLIVPASLAERTVDAVPSVPSPIVQNDPDAPAPEAAASRAAPAASGSLSAPGALATGLPERQPPPPAGAQARDLIGGNFPISNFADSVTGATDVDNPDAAYDPVRNRYLVVWRGDEGATNRNVYGCFVSAAGVVSPTIMLLVNAAGNQGNPAVAYEASAEQFWVVWEDGRSGTLWQVYARRFWSNGASVGDDILVSASANHATDARIVCGGGHCVIVWYEWTADETIEEVYGRAFGATGSPLDAPVRVSGAGTWALWPDVAYNSTDDQYLVVWTDAPTSQNWDIKGQVLNNALSQVGAVIPVSTATNLQLLPRVAYSKIGNRYCVVWQDGRSSTNWDVYGQRLTAAGALQGAGFVVYASAYHDGNPSIAARSNADEFLVSYGAMGDATTRNGAYFEARASAITGAGVVGASFVVRFDANHRASIAVANRAGTNEYLMTWMDTYFGEGDIMGRRVLSNRTLAGD